MTTSPNTEAADLAKAMFRTMERDHGVLVASFFDLDWRKMSDDELIAWSRRFQKKPCPCEGTGKKYDPIAGEDYPCPTCSK